MPLPWVQCCSNERACFATRRCFPLVLCRGRPLECRIEVPCASWPRSPPVRLLTRRRRHATSSFLRAQSVGGSRRFRVRERIPRAGLFGASVSLCMLTHASSCETRGASSRAPRVHSRQILRRLRSRRSMRAAVERQWRSVGEAFSLAAALLNCHGVREPSRRTALEALRVVFRTSMRRLVPYRVISIAAAPSVQFKWREPRATLGP